MYSSRVSVEGAPLVRAIPVRLACFLCVRPIVVDAPGCGAMWDDKSPIKTFDTKEQAEVELKKWNTGIIVEYGYET